ncbi:protein-S-isoprenylcysteine O-methyltransferase [Adelges cooleyi]|uniref:protein-S-isoprenylcysteine O-methyltransferase n=1 Tax=Adelges cooleyi TaxID=133065 RepID=UPI0021806215|nr:protein-S-isoprenylcysteine O-methyltransferase [Adelges cooleyi]XP_050428036.1 protein-S-isoprenylcysteine O-methyltransferase [Adelges cooleyi]XP_050428037.1 protein-S-isoprenylcysteine O-methyltransferase [Adelges cooleyi]XP_050428038.1 protein-S-isoprenylcysteine O-methyltransferase [Adelges cooleyi]
MIAKLGIVSIYGFLLGLPILFVLIPNTFPIIYYIEINVLHLFIIYAVLTHVLVRIINRGIVYNICAQALLLGLTLAAGIIVCVLAPTSWKPFGWYVCVMAVFHYSEFLSIAVCNPKTLSPSSFMLNHSVAYGIAAFASWIEYVLWHIFLPDLKTWHSISYIGIVMCVFGEVLRKTAIWTARHNFTHLVQNEKTQTHSLVTNGVYSWFRHPSYVGWFYWSIGTQWIMINPVCIVAYALASWKFFKERIYYEEMTLLNFFGENYVSYQKKVGIGLPFIRGFEIPNEK